MRMCWMALAALLGLSACGGDEKIDGECMACGGASYTADECTSWGEGEGCASSTFEVRNDAECSGTVMTYTACVFKGCNDMPSCGSLY